MELAESIYKITSTFPEQERYGLVSQMRRSAISIPSNIAEGSNRGSKRDFRKFVLIAYGSGAELKTQILLCKRLGYIDNDEKNIFGLLEEVLKMLNVFSQKLKD